MRVNSEHQAITMKDAATEIGIGLRKLYELLREENIIERTASKHHIARDAYVRQGYFHNEFFTYVPTGSHQSVPAYRVICKANGLSLIKRIVDEHNGTEVDKKPIRTVEEPAGLPHSNELHPGEVSPHRVGATPQR